MSGKTKRLKQVIKERIRVAKYPVGSRLPGVRTAAEEFGVHPNTVSRVYNELSDEGLVRTVQGSCTFVIRRSDVDEVVAATQLAQTLRTIADQARHLGLSRTEFSRLAAEAEAAGYQEDGPTMWFVECSPRDTEELAGSLSTLLERTVRPLLTYELPDHLLSSPDSEQVFITTPFHVDEVEDEVKPRHPVVNINVIPTSDTLVRFAGIDPSARVSVIASNPQTLARFVQMIRTYTRIEPVAAALVTDPDAHLVVRDAEVLIDSQSIHTPVMEWGPTGLVVTVRYQIEPTSVAYLREFLRRRGAGSGVATVGSAGAP